MSTSSSGGKIDGCNNWMTSSSYAPYYDASSSLSAFGHDRYRQPNPRVPVRLGLIPYQPPTCNTTRCNNNNLDGGWWAGRGRGGGGGPRPGGGRGPGGGGGGGE